MSLITGALYPDEGWAMVGGFDVVKQRSQLRKSLGVCPQFDVLYSELTCWEHMHLYGGMQGLAPDECDKEAHRLLGELDLLVKKDQKSSNMSGGQQRRLSLAVSLIGNPKVVLLDEPTTGLDPANRRRVWKVLQQQKRTSTIIMTTHSMEEADLLADSIGVMSKGQIQVVLISSSLFIIMIQNINFRHVILSPNPPNCAGGRQHTRAQEKVRDWLPPPYPEEQRLQRGRSSQCSPFFD
jgi:ABC-type multidrug transport system ATPase subunit